ncbi:MAG: MtrB/PioB family decaheme-associated outer membrane protein [Gammaproteobacteria bacterium]|nr:MtrB/PioB family decaheme-associated outer membrane protein [Gammaproteobacteria bacterium]
MLQRVNNTLLVILIVIALPSAVLAQVDTSGWACELCPFEEGYQADYDAGATYVSDDEARFGHATGYDNKGAYANVAGNGSYTKGGYRLDWLFEDLGLSSRFAQLDGNVDGRFGFSIGYREQPQRQFSSTRTVFTGAAGELALPPGWVSAGTTSSFPQLATALRPVNIESDRQILDLGADWKANKKIRVFAEFQRQNRDGVKISGGAGFTQASLLAKFIDYETDRIDTGIQYADGAATLALNWYGSFFENRNSSLAWQTPFATAPGAVRLQKATAPGSDFQQLSLSGSYRWNTWDTVLAFSLASGQGKQTDALLPYTSNPNIATSVLPVTAMDARVDTVNHALTITSRPLPQGRVVLSYRYDERDNRTQVLSWNRIIADIFDAGETEQNTPYSFERSRFGISGELRVWRDIRLSGGYNRRILKRDYQEVAEQTVDAGWAQARWRPLDWLDLRIKGGTDERDIDRYDETVAVSLGQNPLLRKYNLAYRFRSYGEFSAAITPTDSRWSIGTSVLLADDRFTKSLLGMTDSEELRVTLDLNYAISQRASAYFMAGFEETDALQLGSEQFSSWDWKAKHEDSFEHLGFGVHWRSENEKIDVHADYNRGSGETTINMDSLSGSASRLPDLESTLDTLRASIAYRWNDRLQATLDFRFERFELSDWALVEPDTMATVLTLGAQPYDYDVWALGIGIRYSFGNPNISIPN